MTITDKEYGKLVNWAGQLCEVIDATEHELKLRFTNATGTGELWLSRSANLHKSDSISQSEGV